MLALHFGVSVFTLSADRQDLHSFPTRRSSDLLRARLAHHLHDAAHVAVGEPLVALEEDLPVLHADAEGLLEHLDRKSTRLNSSHVEISYAVFCLKKKSTLAALGEQGLAVSEPT